MVVVDHTEPRFVVVVVVVVVVDHTESRFVVVVVSVVEPNGGGRSTTAAAADRAGL